MQHRTTRSTKAAGPTRGRAPQWCQRVAPVVLAAFVGMTLWTPVWSGQAVAQPRPDDTRARLYLFPSAVAPNVSRITANRIEEFLRAVLTVNDQVHLLGEEDLIIAAQSTARSQAKALNAGITEADALLLQGRELVEQKKFNDAATTLQAAIQKYEEHFADLVDYDNMVDAHVQIAVAYFELGYDDNGEEALSTVASLRPNITVDKRLHSKKFTETLEKLHATFDSYRSGQLTVTSEPAGASVFVDGVRKGNTPVVISDLRKGSHYLQVRQQGFTTFATKLRAPMGDETEQVAATLAADAAVETQDVAGEFVSPEALVPYAETGNFGANFKRAAKSFCERAYVGYLLYAYVSRESDGFSLNLFLYDQTQGEIAALAPVTFDDQLTNAQMKLLEAEQTVMRGISAFPLSRIVQNPPPAVYRQAFEVATAPVVVPAPTPTTGPTAGQPAGVSSVLGDYPAVEGEAQGLDVYGTLPPPQEKKITEEWWFWTAIVGGALVAAGAGVGAAYALGAFDSDSTTTGFSGGVQLP
jgi:hypothetical protein